jgi:hypothetical protein
MADRQHVEIVLRAEPDIAQGSADQLCLWRQPQPVEGEKGI